MNTLTNNTLVAGAEALESRFALRLAARLSENAEQVGPDIRERLRVGREQALERARQARAARTATTRTGVTAAGAAILGGGAWWMKLAAVLPLLALWVGLAVIEQWQSDEQIAAAAEVDLALLADDVPPTAYGDPGFVEFLKTPRN